ncbi:hypothetical protein RhiirA1_470200 [Rhizophagus irregularis]|uniref:Uncharacterized protein n=1 Tax=Rhizophagus irregularis TaxID=588596 RepID=A0A2I1EVK3_9GLOM|nr:hypothetical protein RhiirA1_470200 [Rhizophagus irregularis]PKY26156.1 hypothetical protein RhiirB3_441367 [Rhizophagus irregularis]
MAKPRIRLTDINHKTKDKIDKIEDMNAKTEDMNNRTGDMNDEIEVRNDKTENKIDKTDKTDKVVDYIDIIGSWIKARFAKLAEGFLIVNLFDEFCVNEYSYRNFMNDKKIRKIIFKLIVTLVILSPSAMNFYELLMKIRLPKLRNLIESNFKLYKKLYKGARILRLILFTIIIILQSVENGYLLSNNLWQTKFSTALATVSIIRLFGIYRYDGHSVYASVFGLNYDESDSNGKALRGSDNV